MTISEILKHEIASAQSLYAVAKDTGIGYAIIHGFANGDRSVSLDTAQRLAEHFGLELTKKSTDTTPTKKPATKRKTTAATKKRTTKKRPT